ncbi:MAG TPA: hypothetical protein VMX38_23675 [Verrucomicrobiae bacterium]|nr:hypothetical protein [Verrucomicrobiae bacterium]
MAIAPDMLSTGRRALVGVLAGGAWIAWGLIMARALTPPILTAAILAACLLLVGCGWCIFQGYRSSATGQGSKRGKVNVGFMIVVMFEALAVGCAIFLAQRLERIDLVPDWIGIAVGLHFFGLAKVFHVGVYVLTGMAITAWCVLAWILFRGHALAVSVGLGVGAILWITSCWNLLSVLGPPTAKMD